MRETRRSFQLFGTSHCASQKDTTRQKLLFISTVTCSLVGLGRNQVAAAFWRKTPMQMPSLTVGKRANTSSTGRWIQSAFSRPVNVGSDSSLAWYLWAPTEWAHPGAVPFPPQRTHKANVQCGLRRFPHEGFRWCWFMRTTLYLPPFQGVVPSQHSSTLGVGPHCGLTVH